MESESEQRGILGRREFLALAVAGAVCAAGGDAGAEPMTGEAQRLMALHPAAPALRRLFRQPRRLERGTGLTRADYLTTLAGPVDFFLRHQNAEGAIIDPYERAEKQYSTPAFALAAALLAKEAGRSDLKRPAERAFDFALRALARGTTADNHADFYIPLLVRANALLRPAEVSREIAERTGLFFGLVPERVYRDTNAGGNWNVVNLSGECLRRRAGLVAIEYDGAQSAYIERSLAKQQAAFTRFGMYHDPNAPLAYDAFPRLWLEDMMAAEAYQGPRRAALEEWLTLGGLSTLLLLSPIGEWPCGGRSAHHQWNEAQAAVICEINARRWMGLGQPDVAGAFKRAARLALGSVMRWRRPTGELWIVKNHADPLERFGYEGYSYHSQYNLLAAAMLAMAFQHAEEAIPESLTPAERGGYVFDLREVFHKVVAAAGGYYAEFDTAADPHYNATGLVRVHRTGVTAPLCSDNAAGERAYGPRGGAAQAPLAAGVAWQEEGSDAWVSLAEVRAESGSDRGALTTKPAELRIARESADRVTFKVTYALNRPASRGVSVEVRLGRDGLRMDSTVTGGRVRACRAVVPVLRSDGRERLKVEALAGSVRVKAPAGQAVWTVPSDASAPSAVGDEQACHNGWLQPYAFGAKVGARGASVRLELLTE